MRPALPAAAGDGESLSPSGAGVRQMRRGWRLVRVVMHIGTGFGLALVTGAVFAPDRPLVRRAARWWLHRLTRILQVEIVLRGAPASEPALFVANHVSWLDIPVLGGALPVNFLSKAEVGRWPVIGQLVTAAGTLYIQRGQGQVRERARQIAAHIGSGRPVLVFPEGTTTDGRDVRIFHPPLFAAATEGAHAVQPVALRYVDMNGELHPRVPFVGDDEFHVHLWQLLAEDRIRVEVQFLPPVATAGREHRAVAAEAHARVRAAVLATG